MVREAEAFTNATRGLLLFAEVPGELQLFFKKHLTLSGVSSKNSVKFMRGLEAALKKCSE